MQDVYDPLIAEVVRARPAAETLLTTVRREFAEVYRADLEVIRKRTTLILSAPALRVRSREHQAKPHGTLGRRAGRAQLASGSDLGIQVAVERWAGEGGDLPRYVPEVCPAADRAQREPDRPA